MSAIVQLFLVDVTGGKDIGRVLFEEPTLAVTRCGKAFFGSFSRRRGGIRYSLRPQGTVHSQQGAQVFFLCLSRGGLERPKW